MTNGNEMMQGYGLIHICNAEVDCTERASPVALQEVSFLGHILIFKDLHFIFLIHAH